MNDQDLGPFLDKENGKIRCPCGGEDFSVAAVDGTEPHLTNLNFVCKKCKKRGFTIRNTYPISHTMDFGNDDVVKTEEIPVDCGFDPKDIVGFQFAGKQYCVPCAQKIPPREWMETNQLDLYPIVKGDPDWGYGSVPICATCRNEIPTLKEDPDEQSIEDSRKSDQPSRDDAPK